MDPAEWEKQADDNCTLLAGELDRLDAEFWPENPVASFGSFWPRMKDLGERIRTSPAIRLEDKLHLQDRLSHLVKRARVDQARLRHEQSEVRRSLREALELARDSLADARTVAEVSEVRSDLALLRERVTGAERPTDRGTQAALWSEWQRLNGAAWETLNRLWSDNEAALIALLEDAQERVAAKDPRGAREKIQAFHAAATTAECSHAALKALRDRARTIWNVADELAKQKRASYLANASRRMGQWRSEHDRHSKERAALLREVDELQSRATNAPTPIAGALLRAQAEELRKRLVALDREDHALQAQITAAERALARG